MTLVWELGHKQKLAGFIGYFLNIQRQIFQAYPGREQVQQFNIKEYEMREDLYSLGLSRTKYIHKWHYTHVTQFCHNQTDKSSINTVSTLSQTECHTTDFI